MKKIKIALDDLLVVLESMKETNDTKEIVFMEYNNYPAIADADDMDNIIMFQGVDEEGNVDDETETTH